jgi:glycosyltransferase involved in cell wall biosynthesis
MKLSVIMPVFNEEKTVQHAIQNILKLRSVFELVVVNDGSTDGTSRILSKLAKKYSRKLHVFRKKNGGKGSAVQYGLKKVKGDYVLIQDADLEYDPSDISKLLEPIKKKKAVVVYGSRFLGPHSNLLFWHMIGNHFLNLMTNLLYNTTLSDLETCYKLIPTKLWKEARIESNDFGIEPEITCKILKKGIHIYETPISYVGRDFSEGKKITWKHGFGALGIIVKLRLVR